MQQFPQRIITCPSAPRSFIATFSELFSIPQLSELLKINANVDRYLFKSETVCYLLHFLMTSTDPYYLVAPLSDRILPFTSTLVNDKNSINQPSGRCVSFGRCILQSDNNTDQIHTPNTLFFHTVGCNEHRCVQAPLTSSFSSVNPFLPLLLPVTLTCTEQRFGTVRPSSHVSVLSTLSKDNTFTSPPHPLNHHLPTQQLCCD